MFLTLREGRLHFSSVRLIAHSAELCKFETLPHRDIGHYGTVGNLSEKMLDIWKRRPKDHFFDTAMCGMRPYSRRILRFVKNVRNEGRTQ
jgi:hypothetical protein